MSLIELKHYLQRVKIASLGSMSTYFKCDICLLRQMISHWVKKGYVRKLTKTPHCGSKCLQCGEENFEFYEWISLPLCKGDK